MSIFRTVGGAVAASLCVAVCTAAAGASPDVQAARVISESGVAMGAASFNKIATMRLDAKITAIGLSGTGTQWLDIKGGRFAEIARLGDLIQEDGYDGTSSWSRDRSGLVWNDGSDAGSSAEIAGAYVSDGTLWQPNAGGADVQYRGTQNVEGQSYDVLRVTPPHAKLPIDLFFDRSTHLLSRTVATSGPLVHTTIFSHYRRTHGFMVASEVDTVSSDGNNSKATLTGIHIDPADAAAHLSRPVSNVRDFSMANGVTSTTVPFSLVENHVYVDVMLNGKGPYHFIFDTGGSNVIDPAVAREIGAVSNGQAQGSGVGAATESFSFANVDTLQVGDAVVKHQLFAVAPTRMGFGVSAGHRVDGLIGFEVLARYVTTFDYPNNRIVFTMPSAAQTPANADIVPFVFTGTQPQIACTLDGIPSECSIDTGARDTLSFYSPYVAAHPQVVPAKTTAVGINGFGIGGPDLGTLGRVSEVGIGTFTLKDMIGGFSTQQKGAFAQPFLGANIGGNLLRRFSVTFDYGKQTMALVAGPALTTPDTFERSGLFLLNMGGKIVVAGARPGTPAAEAGLGRGDAITAIDGTATSTMSLDDVRAFFYKPAGTVVHLTVTHKDGSSKDVAITLRDYV